VTIPGLVTNFLARPLESKPRVLVVDDSPEATSAALSLLEDSDYVCRTAAHGGEALSLLAAESFDLVFLDVQMPVADGYEVARRIRKDKELERNSNVPIVGMSASVPSEADATLFNFFLKKPFAFSPSLVNGFLVQASQHELATAAH
jgi:CheY-like chemotaxis protein